MKDRIIKNAGGFSKQCSIKHLLSLKVFMKGPHVMKNTPMQNNHFIALYLPGHYFNNEYIPEYLKPGNFKSSKENIDKVFQLSADSKYWLEQESENMFDAFCLVNMAHTVHK